MSKSINGKPDLNLPDLAAGERDLLARASAMVSPPPDRQRMLAGAYAASESDQKETTMIPNPIFKLFAGHSAGPRIAWGGALLIAVLALSLVLPRGGGINPVASAWAASDGFVLTFDFGPGSTPEQAQPILDELHRVVREFKAKHNLPAEQAQRFATHSDRRVVKKVERHGDSAPVETREEESRVIAMIALPSSELLAELEAELAQIPGLPAPSNVNATWFSANGLPDPNKPGIHLALSLDNADGSATEPHMFYFPEDATEADVESSINDWLAENRPGINYTVDVTLKRAGERLELSVNINGKSADETVEVAGPVAE